VGVRALEFKVTARNRARLWALAAEFDPLVIAAGGRFYFAKDSTLTRASREAFLEAEGVARFLAVKRECDPEGLLATDLYRRLFAESAPPPSPRDVRSREPCG
jgi:FAD/FMN-containing dehydrogenase